MPPREHHNIQGDSSPDPSGVITSLDELAKGLASGTMSRREAVRLLGVALLGGALASVLGVARAAPNPQAACAQFCTVFPPGPQRGQCLQQGAQGRGPCYECNQDLGFPGPNFQCPPDQVKEFDPVTGTCCHACSADGVLCQDENGENGCYSREFRCGNGGTFDASNCQCVCPPGTALCKPGVGVSGCCVGGCPEGMTLCGGTCVSNFCPGQAFNPSTCQCEDCLNGTTFCGGNCVPDCPPGQTLNSFTCQCASPGPTSSASASATAQ